MLINPDAIDDVFWCKKKTYEFLLYKCKLPLLGLKNDLYGFRQTPELDECLKRLPVLLKIFNI